MGLFSALGQIVAAPIHIADTVVKDLKGDNDDVAQGASIASLGLTSVVRGIAKSIEKAADELN